MKKSIFRIALIATIVASMMLFGTMTAFAATEVTSAEDFDAAGDYVLGDDITGNVTLSEGTYTIDLAGYEWKGNLTIQGADVTITDSDAGKFGLMASDDNDVIIIESGKLTTTEITIAGNAGGCDGIFAKGGEVVINNCTISALNAAIQNKGGTMTVNGGTYSSMKVNNNSFITVNGATVEGGLNIGDANTTYNTIDTAFVPGEGFKMETVAGGYNFVEGSSDDAGNNDAGNDDAGEQNPPSGDVISLAVLAFSALSACTVVAKKKEN